MAVGPPLLPLAITGIIILLALPSQPAPIPDTGTVAISTGALNGIVEVLQRELELLQQMNTLLTHNTLNDYEDDDSSSSSGDSADGDYTSDDSTSDC